MFLKLPLSHLSPKDKEGKESFLTDLKEGHIAQWAINTEDIEESVLIEEEEKK